MLAKIQSPVSLVSFLGLIVQVRKKSIPGRQDGCAKTLGRKGGTIHIVSGNQRETSVGQSVKGGPGCFLSRWSQTMKSCREAQAAAARVLGGGGAAAGRS